MWIVKRTFIGIQFFEISYGILLYDKEIIEKKTNYTCVMHFASFSVWGHVTMGRDPVTSWIEQHCLTLTGLT